jgi:hypothetical protein
LEGKVEICKEEVKAVQGFRKASEQWEEVVVRKELFCLKLLSSKQARLWTGEYIFSL